MDIKRYHKDWAKDGARFGLGEKIDQLVLSYKKPKNCRVVHFPGVDCEEAKQVYFRRGIPPKNIVGIEREASIAQIIEEQNTGMVVENTTAEKYFVESDPFFVDVVSLDYIGPVNTEQLVTIQQIVSKQRCDVFILHVANLLRRDHNSKDLYQMGYSMGSFETENHNGMRPWEPRKVFQDTVRRTNQIGTKVMNGDSIQEEKKESYSALINASIANVNVDQMNNFFKFVTGKKYKSAIRHVERELSKIFCTPVELNYDNPFKSNLPPVLTPIVDSMLSGSGMIHFRNHCLGAGIGQDAADCLMWALQDGTTRKRYYQTFDAFNYSYISESGAPMIGNVLGLKYAREQIPVAKKIARLIGYPRGLDIQPTKILLKLLKKYARKNLWHGKREELKILEKNENNRVFLGSSARPVLSKKRAIEELKKGTSIVEIREKYRGGKNLNLPQIKAHVTMGTYGPVNGGSIEEKLEGLQEDELESVEDGDIEKITKEEMLDLLSAGYPPKEIFDVYPTSFTLMQLRGHLAAITRRRNLEK